MVTVMGDFPRFILAWRLQIDMTSVSLIEVVQDAIDLTEMTDVGGALSHCGIVAREYGIPCVGGTTVATAKIPDGAMIEVDGTSGEVRILSGV
jgi:phosphoenolpyruvate-protein kinase (PTS system EI component)